MIRKVQLHFDLHDQFVAVERMPMKWFNEDNHEEGTVGRIKIRKATPNEVEWHMFGTERVKDLVEPKHPVLAQRCLRDEFGS